MNKMIIGTIGLCAMLSIPVVPKGVDTGSVLVSNDHELVMCIKRIAPITETDRIEMAKCIYAECRGESVECQRGVCAVLYNRYKTGEYACMHDVIFAPNQFATDNFDNIDQADIADQLYIVDKTIEYGASLPEYVIYFRASHYHTMSDAEDFVTIDKTFFSYSKKLYNKYIGESE